MFIGSFNLANVCYSVLARFCRGANINQEHVKDVALMSSIE